MKKLFSLFLLLNYIYAKAQLATFYVQPSETDINYAAAQDSHYVALNNSVVSNGKLFVFIGGTGSSNKNYTDILKLAANLGYHAVGVGYPNTPSISSSCAGSADPNCFYDFRREICYGIPVSSSVSVDTFNSIHIRLIKLLQYLDSNYPLNGWGTFLSSGEPVWDLCAFGGHSQGAGHALYFGKTNNCDRILMFSGANDYSVFYSSAASWVSMSGPTPVNKYFSFLHKGDDVLDYAKQYSVISASGMLLADDSTLVDILSPPYGTSHCLYTDITPLYSGVYSSYHNATAIGFFIPWSGGAHIYDPVWTYMLSASVTTGIAESKSKDNSVLVYPDPVVNELHVEFPDANQEFEIELFNSNGQCISKFENSKRLFVSDLSKGIYFLKIAVGNQLYCARFVK